MHTHEWVEGCLSNAEHPSKDCAVENHCKTCGAYQMKGYGNDSNS